MGKGMVVVESVVSATFPSIKISRGHKCSEGRTYTTVEITKLIFYFQFL